jgi:hypothetical protein
MKKLLKHFEPLNEGLKRIIYVLTIVPISIGLNNASEIYNEELGDYIGYVLIGVFIYWISVLTVCWIYAGFKEK